MIAGVGSLIAEVDDMSRATEFYRDVLQLEPIFQSAHWSTFRMGELTLALHPNFGGVPSRNGGGWVLGFTVTDIQSLRARLIARDVPVGEYHQTPGGVVMDLQDPDGNRLQAMQRDANLPL